MKITMFTLFLAAVLATQHDHNKTVFTPEERSRSVVEAYMVESGYPKGRPGFVVDHSIPLCAGGPDDVSNMTWQEVKESYQKDVFERRLCKEMKRQGLILTRINPDK